MAKIAKNACFCPQNIKILQLNAIVFRYVYILKIGPERGGDARAAAGEASGELRADGAAADYADVVRHRVGAPRSGPLNPMAGGDGDQ